MKPIDVPEQLTLFVYYKLPAIEHQRWSVCVRENTQRLMQEIPGLTIELMQRPDPSASGEETWMEVYRHSNGLSPQMMELIEQVAKELDLPSKRATEVFVSLR
jgi:hypothetical protein